MNSAPPFDRTASGRPQTPSFALRHPFLVHGAFVLVCWSSYEFDRVDVVWRCIRDSSNARTLEHIGFGLAALLIAVGVWLGAWPGGRRANLAVGDPRDIRRRCLGEILHAAGIASLLPVAGALLLIFGEVIRSTLFARWKTRAVTSHPSLLADPSDTANPSLSWRFLLRHTAGICAFLCMLTFSITLRDRQADFLFMGTALVFIATRFIDVP